MTNVDPDFHYQASPPQPPSSGTTAFRGLTLVCAIGALSGLIDMLVSISTSSRLDNSILMYSVPALIVLSALFLFRTTDKRATCAGIIAFLCSSLAQAGNHWIAGLVTPDYIAAGLAILRVGLFGAYGILLIGGFFFLFTADKMADALRLQLTRR